MTAAPVPHVWSFLEDATSANLQTLTDAIEFLLDPPRCTVVMSADVNDGNGTVKLVDWDGTEVQDTDGMHSSVTNPSRIIAQHDGLFLFIVQIGWANNSTGRREIHLRKNAAGSAAGGTALGSWQNQSISGFVSTCLAVEEIPLVTGDYVEVFATQNSGGTLARVASGSACQARWVAIA